ncbi:MAG TPA: hypothetical protein VL634_20795 [Mycobacterium sp.]|nr:hypothetical protein [Mycobacterium sp.]
MTGRHLPPAVEVESYEQPSAVLVRLPGPAYGSDEVAAKNLAGWLGDRRPVESRIETVDGERIWVHYEVLTRHQAAVACAREALTQTTVPHSYTQTCPHPRIITDLAKQWYGIDLTAAEIQAALIEVMA